MTRPKSCYLGLRRQPGTELSHYNLFQNALICQAFVQKYRPEDVCLCVLPLFHSFGQTAC